LKTLLFIIITGLCLQSGLYAEAAQNEAGSQQFMTGPTLQLNYDSNTKINPVYNFMYFIPLTSPTSVSVEMAEGTTFTAHLTSWKKKQSKNTVFVECDFKVVGEGAYSVIYDPNEMIGTKINCKDYDENDKKISTLLEWIRLDGPCLGHVKAVGVIDGDNVRMDSIDVSFNRDGTKSPVQVSLYDIVRKDNKFTLDNRVNGQVARINTIKFQRTQDSPEMSVEIASLTKNQGKEGFLSRLTAMVANILSTSTPISEVGNDTMMDFGLALYQKQDLFVFPRAVNVKEEL
jgi:hypothetical protein